MDTAVYLNLHSLQRKTLKIEFQAFSASTEVQVQFISQLRHIKVYIWTHRFRLYGIPLGHTLVCFRSKNWIEKVMQYQTQSNKQFQEKKYMEIFCTPKNSQYWQSFPPGQVHLSLNYSTENMCFTNWIYLFVCLVGEDKQNKANQIHICLAAAQKS